jgi:hypothetical protein
LRVSVAHKDPRVGEGAHQVVIEGQVRKEKECIEAERI